MQYLVAENGSLNLLRFVSIYSALGRGLGRGGCGWRVGHFYIKIIAIFSSLAYTDNNFSSSLKFKAVRHYKKT